MTRWLLSTVLVVLSTSWAFGRAAVTCAGIAMLGGAQLVCSQADPQAASQFCSYSWALVTPANATQVVEGSFTLPTGASNLQIYQGSGFDRASSNPIVLCHGARPSN